MVYFLPKTRGLTMSNEIDLKDFNFKDFQREFADRAKAGEPLTGKDGILTPLFKKLLEATLDISKCMG